MHPSLDVIKGLFIIQEFYCNVSRCLEAVEVFHLPPPPVENARKQWWEATSLTDPYF